MPDSSPPDDLQSSYDCIAEEYVAHVYDELSHKPLDQKLLDRFASIVKEIGPACDVGCGPGQIARYLHDRGVDVHGIDLSAGMIEQARRLNPGIDFRQGNMLALDAPDGTWAGITAFYSIIHLPRPDVVKALREMHRVLRPGGLLLLAFHLGDETLHVDEMWGRAVSLDFAFFQPAEMKDYLESVGFRVDEILERDPHPDIEYQSRRAYIFARKSGK